MRIQIHVHTGEMNVYQAYTCLVALAFNVPDTTLAVSHHAQQVAVVRFPDREPKGIRWMPWLEEAKKGVARLRKASGRCLATFDPEISEWGNPLAVRQVLYSEYIGI